MKLLATIFLTVFSGVLTNSDNSILSTITTPKELPAEIQLNVPFTPQAPFGIWDADHNEACEEAALVMVNAYLDNEKLTPETADTQILRLIGWEELNGYKVDVDAHEMGQLAKDYLYKNYKIYYDDQVTEKRIKNLLNKGYPVILPVAGQMLGNPYFRGEGPPYHVIVLIGYNETNFITHDPGTRNGESYEYSIDTIMNSIHDWTGSKQTIKEGRKAMLIMTP